MESEKRRKIEQDVPNQDSVQFEVKEGVDIVVINEDRGNFSPMFLFSTETVTFSQTSGLGQLDVADGTAETILSTYYFNQIKSHWEPIVERVELVVDMKRVKNQYLQVVRLEKPLNINVSVYLSGVINDFLKLWEKSTLRAQAFQKKIKEGNDSVFLSTSFRQGRSAAQSHLNQNNVLLMDKVEASADIVSPFALRNLTDRTIVVQLRSD